MLRSSGFFFLSKMKGSIEMKNKKIGRHRVTILFRFIGRQFEMGFTLYDIAITQSTYALKLTGYMVGIHWIYFCLRSYFKKIQYNTSLLNYLVTQLFLL